MIRYHEISPRRVANGPESNGLYVFSRIRGIAEHGFGRLFIASGISYFFNPSSKKQL